MYSTNGRPSEMRALGLVKCVAARLPRTQPRGVVHLARSGPTQRQASPAWNNIRQCSGFCSRFLCRSLATSTGEQPAALASGTMDGVPTTGPHVVRYSLRATACFTPPRADSLVDFAKLDVRIGHILEAKIHPDADRYAREPGSCVGPPIGTKLRPISKPTPCPLCAPHSF